MVLQRAVAARSHVHLRTHLFSSWSPAADIFSLGVVLSMLVQGRHPFPVPDEMDQQYAEGWMDVEERHLYEEELQNAKLQRSRVFEDYVDAEVRGCCAGRAATIPAAATT